MAADTALEARWAGSDDYGFNLRLGFNLGRLVALDLSGAAQPLPCPAPVPADHSGVPGCCLRVLVTACK